MTIKKEEEYSSYYLYDQKLRNQGYKLLLGLDEVGRGSWAGPLVVCGCILKPDYYNHEIKDSKKLSIQSREKLFDEIINNCLAYKIFFIEPNKVDELNPKKASIFGMEHIVKTIDSKFDLILSDAEKLNTKKPLKVIINGDNKSFSIAAASILAKVARDRYMINISDQYPGYNFKNHKGYGTLDHLKKLKKYGPIKDFHRYSYKPIKNLVNTLKTQ